MENIRFKALEATLNRKPVVFKLPSGKISDYFGEQTFSQVSMQEFLPEDAFNQVVRSVEKGEKIDRKMADQIASSLKAWAMSKGATHYTHWFHPLQEPLPKNMMLLSILWKGEEPLRIFRASS